MTEILEPQTSTAFDELVRSTRRIVRAEERPSRVSQAIADTLPAYLERGDLLDGFELTPDPLRYRQHILHVESDGSFSIAALVWLPGQETPIHDHISWCVVGVYQGEEYETHYDVHDEDGAAFLVPTGNGVNGLRAIGALTPPGDIHKVANRGDGVAISLHVYGADLHAAGCSVRRRYDLPVREA